MSWWKSSPRSSGRMLAHAPNRPNGAKVRTSSEVFPRGAIWPVGSEVREAVDVEAVRIHLRHQFFRTETEVLQLAIRGSTGLALGQVVDARIENVLPAGIGVEQATHVVRALERDHFESLFGQVSAGG